MASSIIEVFFSFFRLGLTSFGGPIAHLGYFHDEFVRKKKWINENLYADIVTFCQFLPGPASSQVGLTIGFTRAGMWGAFAAWLGFTLPSALLLTLFGIGVSQFPDIVREAWLPGLKLVAVSIVAHALGNMAIHSCYEWRRIALALAVAGVAFYFRTPEIQIASLVVGGFVGRIFLKDFRDSPHTPLAVPFSKKTGVVTLGVFAGMLLGLPILSHAFDSQALQLFERFFRAGSLVFGGGHVVLPLLKTAVVDPGWVTANDFMTGYGAAQAVPGPLFTFAAYLGAVSSAAPSGWIGAGICLVALFLPSFFLVFGSLPFWESIRGNPSTRAILMGMNAAVVGLLLSAFIDPVCTSALHAPIDFFITGAGLFLLERKCPSWAVILLVTLSSKFMR